MNTIHLHGSLKKSFGGPFTLRVATPAEAVRALCIMLPGFRDAVRDGTWRVIRGKKKNGVHLGVDELHMNLGGEMHLAPALKGSKRGNGTAKTVIGVILIVVAAVLTWYAGGAGGVAAAGAQGGAAGAAGGAGAAGASTGLITGTGLSTTIGGVITTGQLAMMGIALTFAGISQMLAPTPKKAESRNDRSYLLSGNVNTTEQGTPIPVAIGRVRTGSIVISAGMDVAPVDETGSGATVAGQLTDPVLIEKLKSNKQ